MLIALLAVCARLAAGIAPLPPMDLLAGLGGADICHADGTSTPADAGGTAAHDCALCPLCLSALPPLVTGPAPTAPLRVAFTLRYILPPPAAAPPAAAFATARPRGPPALA